MARERSPNYPAYGLPAALQFAKMLWNKEKRTPVSMETIATALGSKGVSGPVRSKVAAMRQYGLVQPMDGNLRVSDVAITLILQRPGQSEYEKAAKEAALAPELFETLYNDRPDASDEALKFYLVRDLRFSPDGAERMIGAYRASLSFAKLDESSYTGEEGANPEGDSPSGDPGKPPGQAPETRRQRAHGGNAVSFSFSLPSGVTAEVIFDGGTPTKRSVAKLRQYLELFEDDLADETPAPQRHAVTGLAIDPSTGMPED